MQLINEILNGKYRVEELLGSGGMSEVYRAVQLLTRKSVSVKILKEDCRDNPEYLRRFEREARTVLHLSDPNIVHAIDVGRFHDIPYIILEYVEGKTLKQLIEGKGAFSQKDAIGYCTQILHALSVAHSAGIIHRDVKPQNILVTADGVAKLTDFGIAREMQASTMTFAGSTVLGSAQYLSPEQAKGLPVNEESDIYSVGVILYEMLTGTIPFDGDSSVSIALKQINEAPMPPIELNPSIYPSINEAVLCALQKDPDLRFRSADQMIRALEKCQRNPDFHPTFQNLAEDSKKEKGSTKSIEKSNSDSISNIHFSWKIVFFIGILLMAFVGTFFGIRFIFSDDSSRVFVPSVVNKSLAEATQKAENYGFQIEVSEYEISNEVSFGSIISQSPKAGQKIKPGSTLSVVVSAGSDAPTVPDVVGKTYDEAVSALSQAGYSIGTISYSVSTQAIGYVCSQSPAAGVDASIGSPINICISATSAAVVTMPNLLLMPLTEAVSTLEKIGTFRVLVDYDDSPAQVVTLQDPSEGATLVINMLVKLTSGGAPDYNYYADFAYSIDIESPNTSVIVTISDDVDGYPVERILYNKMLEPGTKIPLSFTATAPETGTYEITVYMNNKDIIRKDITISK